MHPLATLLVTISLLALLAVIFWPEGGLYARWQRARRITTRVLMEDALKHLFTCELDGRIPSLESIAGALTISPNEAAGIAAGLEQRAFANLAGGEFRLTDHGREYALRVIRAHRLWESYLSERTGYAEADWHTIAEQEEHNLSPADADALAASLGNPSHDPHGDPIPTSEGELVHHAGDPLTNLAAGRTARIVHIEDEPAVIYSQIIAEGLHTGMTVRILEANAERVRFWANGSEHILAPLLAKNISVVAAPRVDPQSVPNGAPLSTLKVGEKARVTMLAPAIRGAERRRLMDLGLLPGTEIMAELQSPSGDPTAYLVRGALIALRAEQAQHIKIARNGAES